MKNSASSNNHIEDEKLDERTDMFIRRKKTDEKINLRNISPKPNKIILNKIKERDEEEEKEKIREKKRLQHQENLRAKMNELKEKKKEEEEKKRELEKIEDEKLREQSKIENKIIKKEQEKKKNVLKEYKEKLETEKRMKEQLQEDFQKKIEKEKKKEQEGFLKKQFDKLKDQFNNQINERIEKNQKNSEKETKNNEKLILSKKRAENLLQKQKEDFSKLKQFNERIERAFESKKFKEVVAKYEKILFVVYNFYKNHKEDLIEINGFVNFASNFKFIPGIISIEQIQLIFRIITKKMNNPPFGLDFNDFLLGILRIIIIFYESSIGKKLIEIDDCSDENYINIFEKEFIKFIELMELGNDKTILIKRLNSMKNENSKVVSNKDKKNGIFYL